MSNRIFFSLIVGLIALQVTAQTSKSTASKIPEFDCCTPNNFADPVCKELYKNKHALNHCDLYHCFLHELEYVCVYNHPFNFFAFDRARSRNVSLCKKNEPLADPRICGTWITNDGSTIYQFVPYNSDGMVLKYRAFTWNEFEQEYRDFTGGWASYGLRTTKIGQLDFLELCKSQGYPRKPLGYKYK